MVVMFVDSVAVISMQLDMYLVPNKIHPNIAFNCTLSQSIFTENRKNIKKNLRKSQHNEVISFYGNASTSYSKRHLVTIQTAGCHGQNQFPRQHNFKILFPKVLH